jgi:hypothetical protein
MARSKGLAALEKLHEFFRSEIQAEVTSGFARLVRMPDSHVVDKLRYYGSLSETDISCPDCGMLVPHLLSRCSNCL